MSAIFHPHWKTSFFMFFSQMTLYFYSAKYVTISFIEIADAMNKQLDVNH